MTQSLDRAMAPKPGRAALVTSMPVRNRSVISTYFDKWRQVGFDVYSINSEHERQAFAELEIPNLRILSAQEDASALYKRPLIFIDEAVAKARQLSSDYPVVGLVNADVLPSFLFEWSDLLSTISEESLHCFKRLDLERFPGGTCNSLPATYPFGYDMFLWRSASQFTLSRDPCNFAFGIPWWDYWMPLALKSQGLNVVSHNSAWIYHDQHDANFSPGFWAEKGNEFLQFLDDNKISLSADRGFSTPADQSELERLAQLSVRSIDAGKFHTFKPERPLASGVSIVTACMNRNENLTKAIETWLNADSIDEIIVVDWSSSTPVRETLSDLKDKRVKIIRIDGRDAWCLSLAYNEGFRHVRFDKILKLDADVTLAREFVAENPIESDFFRSGDWRTARNDREKRLNGSFFAPTSPLLAVGGYNEHIRTYGWDDCDLYGRLELILERQQFDVETIRHLDQDEESRLANQSAKLGLRPLVLPAGTETELEIRVNEFLATLSPDWPQCREIECDRRPAKAAAYKLALIKELGKPFENFGFAFNTAGLSRLSLDALMVLFACRHSETFWKSKSAIEVFDKLMCLPLRPRDAAVLVNDCTEPSTQRLMRRKLPLSTASEGLVFSNRLMSQEGWQQKLKDDSLLGGLFVPPDTANSLIPEFEGLTLSLGDQMSLKSRGKSVTSITTVFNSGRFIDQLLEDILSQTFFDQTLFVFVVCASTEGEYEKLSAFCESYPTNTVLVMLPYDPGLYGSWNAVIKASSTEFITNWNTDDRRSPWHIEKLVTFLEDNPEFSVASAALLISYEENVTFSTARRNDLPTWFEGRDREFGFKDLFQLNEWEMAQGQEPKVVSQNFCHCMPIWRRLMHTDLGYFDEQRFGPSADWEYWLRAASNGHRFHISGEALGVYYCNPRSYGRNERAAEGERNILDTHLDTELMASIMNGAVAPID